MQVVSAIKEFYDAENADETLSTLNELNLPSESLWDLVRRGATAAMDRRSEDHPKLGRLLGSLVEKGFLNSEHVSAAYV
jgi:hypothetical protein